jgi:hypothetical protein
MNFLDRNEIDSWSGPRMKYLDAVMCNNIENLLHLIKAGISCTSVVIKTAIRFNKLESFIVLITAISDEYKYVFSNIAATEPNLTYLRFLADSGCHFGFSEVQEAIKSGNLEGLRLLHNLGCDMFLDIKSGPELLKNMNSLFKTSPIPCIRYLSSCKPAGWNYDMKKPTPDGRLDLIHVNLKSPPNWDIRAIMSDKFDIYEGAIVEIDMRVVPTKLIQRVLTATGLNGV